MNAAAVGYLEDDESPKIQIKTGKKDNSLSRAIVLGNINTKVGAIEVEVDKISNNDVFKYEVNGSTPIKLVGNIGLKKPFDTAHGGEYLATIPGSSPFMYDDEPFTKGGEGSKDVTNSILGRLTEFKANGCDTDT